MVLRFEYSLLKILKFICQQRIRSFVLIKTSVFHCLDYCSGPTITSTNFRIISNCTIFAVHQLVYGELEIVTLVFSRSEMNNRGQSEPNRFRCDGFEMHMSTCMYLTYRCSHGAYHSLNHHFTHFHKI